MSEFEIPEFKENFDIETHSFRTSWWIRFGILGAFLVIFTMIALAANIDYPQFVEGKFKLYSTETSVNVPMLRFRKIADIFIKNGSPVKKDQAILAYNDNANLKDILSIKHELDVFSNSKLTPFELYTNLDNLGLLRLGSLQNAYSQLMDLLLENYLNIKFNKVELKINSLNSNISKLGKIRTETNKILEIDKLENEVVKNQFKIDSVLYVSNSISLLKYLTSKENYLAKTKFYQNNVISYERLNSEISTLSSSINELNNENLDKIEFLKSKIRITLSEFIVLLSAWEDDNLVVSPIDGNVNYIGYFNVNDQIVDEKSSIVITPNSNVYKAIVEIPFVRAGEVSIGKRVILKLDDFPFRDYGFLSGTLSSISNVAGEESYLCEVELDEGLKNSEFNNILLREGMGGAAQIVIQDRSILSLIFNHFTSMFKTL